MASGWDIHYTLYIDDDDDNDDDNSDDDGDDDNDGIENGDGKYWQWWS